MRTTSQKKTVSVNKFLKNRITQPESIVGGEKGPIIERDKIKVPRTRY